MNRIKTNALFAVLSLLTSTVVLAAPTDDYFKDLMGQEFVDNGENTVHEWVYDFLLAVEEGDEELLRERLQELKQADAGNRALLLDAGTNLAKELRRDRQWQMLKGRLNRIASIPANFSLEAAEACELTRQRNAEKARDAGNSSVTEALMSNTAFKTAFVIAASLPVAAAATTAVSLARSLSLVISDTQTLVTQPEGIVVYDPVAPKPWGKALSSVAFNPTATRLPKKLGAYKIGRNYSPALRSKPKPNHDRLYKTMAALRTIPEKFFDELSRTVAKDFADLTFERFPHGVAVNKLTDNWISLIAKGLPFDLGGDFYKADSEEERFWQNTFIWKLLKKVDIDVNKMERNGFTFFENALQRGDLENIKLMKEKGAHTHRPIIAVTTDARGWAFRGGARAVEKRGAIALPLAVPFTAYMKAKDFRAFAQNPRGMLTSGNSEVEAIVDHVRSVFKIADAIWISGGDHVWEFWYKNATVVHPRVLERDVLEMAVLYLQEQEVYKPVIGVCRGMQLANVFHGGSLREKEEFGPTQIWVTKQDGLLGKNFPDGATGHSMHHQSLDTVAEILQPVAESAIGVVEAVQSKNRELPLIGTQYHPEFTAESDLMRNYIMDLIFDMAEAAKHQTCLNDNNVRDAHFSKSHKSGFLSYLSE